MWKVSEYDLLLAVAPLKRVYITRLRGGLTRGRMALCNVQVFLKYIIRLH